MAESKIALAGLFGASRLMHARMCAQASSEFGVTGLQNSGIPARA
jgi:hypothetical protein